MRWFSLIVCSFALIYSSAFAQTTPEKVDSSIVAKMKDEGWNRSQVMNYISYMCDVYGARLTGSPEYIAAAEWVKKEMEKIGLENVHLESWGPFGIGWSLKKFYAHALKPTQYPIIAYPKAWSPGLKGTVRGKLLYLNAANDSALNLFKGRLKNAIVLMGDAREVVAHFNADARRMHDTSLLKLANAVPGSRGRSGRRPEMTTVAQNRFMLQQKKLEMCINEGAACILEPASGDDGTVFVQQVSLPAPPGAAFNARPRPYDRKQPKNIPQIAVAVEQYNRFIRTVTKGIDVELELQLEVQFSDKDSMGYNIIGEIPGSDLKDEVVMAGAHFDSWHTGTGATDNAAGSAVCMEAMRLFTTLGLKPRRTVRIALWGGEEQGLLGSRAYVADHLAVRDTTVKQGEAQYKHKPEFEKFSAYFNLDNGTGKIRGVYMQENEGVRNIFRQWLTPFQEMGASTLSTSNTGGTDHGSFDQVGIPGFQFIQDPIDYDTRTHHSNMDVYDRIQVEDMKQAAIIMASFAYHAAMRDEKLPRKSRAVQRTQ